MLTCEDIEVGDLKNLFVSVSGVCTTCDAPCLQCEERPDKCLNCMSPLYLYDFACDTSCPAEYTANYLRICELTGFVCPFGYAANAAGTGCVLKA